MPDFCIIWEISWGKYCRGVWLQIHEEDFKKQKLIPPECDPNILIVRNSRDNESFGVFWLTYFKVWFPMARNL